MPINEGAVITGWKDLDNLVSVQQVPFPKLEDDAIIVRAVAYAVNPTDWKHIFPVDLAATMTSGVFKKFALGIEPLGKVLGYVGFQVGGLVGRGLTILQRGAVSGSDLSGIVESVGKNVKNFKKGDFVATSLHGGINKNGGFAKYVLVSPNTTIKLSPSQIVNEPLSVGQHRSSGINSFEAAASVPLGLKTIAISFQYNLAIPQDKAKNKNDYILIWGGATATGFLAIQVAKLVYGLKVIATASKKHHEKLLALGADKVFDYHEPHVVEKLKQAGQGNIKFGYDIVSTVETLQSTYDATEGSQNVAIDNLLFLDSSCIELNDQRNDVKLTFTNLYLADGKRHLGFVASEELLDSYLQFWEHSLPPILGKLQTAPLEVLDASLESANEGLKLMYEGRVSGRKVVFRNNDEV